MPGRRLLRAPEDDQAAAAGTGEEDEEQIQYPFFTEGTHELLEARNAPRQGQDLEGQASPRSRTSMRTWRQTSTSSSSRLGSLCSSAQTPVRRPSRTAAAEPSRATAEPSRGDIA
uniref:Uncharacterized protein n=1 Tax=Arundo donax TaxID=35708 RepID=A0A0A9GP65_ARUDO